MTEKLLRWLSFGALAFLVVWGAYSAIRPEINIKEIATQNAILSAQLLQSQQQLQNQNSAFAQIYQNAETRSVVQKHFPNLFQPVQPAASNGAAPR